MSRRATSSAAYVVLAALMALVLGPAYAQRDPTAAPYDAGASADAGKADSPLGGGATTSVIVRDGKPYLVVGSRLVAPGERVGQAKLERITETEIWLRDGTTLTKLPRFDGIQRTSAAAPGCKPETKTKAKAKAKARTTAKKNQNKATPAASPSATDKKEPAVAPAIACEAAKP